MRFNKLIQQFDKQLTTPEIRTTTWMLTLATGLTCMFVEHPGLVLLRSVLYALVVRAYYLDRYKLSWKIAICNMTSSVLLAEGVVNLFGDASVIGSISLVLMGFCMCMERDEDDDDHRGGKPNKTLEAMFEDWFKEKESVEAAPA